MVCRHICELALRRTGASRAAEGKGRTLPSRFDHLMPAAVCFLICGTAALIDGILTGNAEYSTQALVSPVPNSSDTHDLLGNSSTLKTSRSILQATNFNSSNTSSSNLSSSPSSTSMSNVSSSISSSTLPSSSTPSATPSLQPAPNQTSSTSAANGSATSASSVTTRLS